MSIHIVIECQTELPIVIMQTWLFLNVNMHLLATNFTQKTLYRLPVVLLMGEDVPKSALIQL